jgi:hypothetical protein
MISGIAAATLLLLASVGHADEGDPPERVGVLDLVEGAAAAQLAGASDWTADLANRPLTTGDKVWVDANSRAELHIGSAAIRLGANTGLQFLNVGDRVAQLRLSAGSMNLRLRYLSPDEAIEVDTPNSAISLLQAGEYRIDVNDTGDAVVVVVAVWRGQAEVAGQSQSFNLQQQQQGMFQGTGTLGVQFSDLPPADNLDQWSQYLDQREDESLTANFMSRDMTGYNDLDGYGNWQADPDYGSVWYPPVDAGWAPYSQGCWIWVAPWGWTWVDNAPWGFVPFHYGRWVHVRAGWVWSPGQLTVRPVYAPALVAWGTGPNSRISWVALGYNELYRPSRSVSSAYLRRVNVSNTYINSTVTMSYGTLASAPRYANQSIAGAVLGATRETFTSARPVNGESSSTGADQMLISAGNSVQPTRTSLVRAAKPGRAAAPVPPHAIFSTPTVARSAPPALRRGAAPERSRLVLTSVPVAQALPRALEAPLSEVPGRNDSPGMHPAPVVRQSSHESLPNNDAAARSAAPASRVDRPVLMPRSAPERPLTEPDRPAQAAVRPALPVEHAPMERAPITQRSAPPLDTGEHIHSERSAEAPAKKEAPPPVAPRRPPEKNPQ